MHGKVGDGRVPLLRERRREEPGDHHVDVVFFRADGGGNLLPAAKRA